MKFSLISSILIAGSAAIFNPLKLIEQNDYTLTTRSYGKPYPEEELLPRQFSNTSFTNMTTNTTSYYRSHVKRSKLPVTD